MYTLTALHIASPSLLLTVGYTMTDIRYKWNDGLNSVQISSDVSLPQFKVLGHRQKIIEAELSTGKLIFLSFEDLDKSKQTADK